MIIFFFFQTVHINRVCMETTLVILPEQGHLDHKKLSDWNCQLTRCICQVADPTKAISNKGQVFLVSSLIHLYQSACIQQMTDDWTFLSKLFHMFAPKVVRESSLREENN